MLLYIRNMTLNEKQFMQDHKCNNVTDKSTWPFYIILFACILCLNQNTENMNSLIIFSFTFFPSLAVLRAHFSHTVMLLGLLKHDKFICLPFCNFHEGKFSNYVNETVNGNNAVNSLMIELFISGSLFTSLDLCILLLTEDL